MTAHHTAAAISDWFLAWAEADDAEISNLKLQKLLYYAQGHHLGEGRGQLFGDRIEAWAHGPVVPSEYRRFKTYGSGPIEPDDTISEDFAWENYRDVEAHLIRIWNTYGPIAAWALRNRTHSEAPWKSTFDADVMGAAIPEAKMKEFFAALNG